MQATRRAALGFGILLVGAALLRAGAAESDLPVMDGVPTAAPEDVGMSSARLARLERALQAYVDRSEVAGAVSLVARKGKVVHFSALGDRVAGGGAPMTHDAIFRIASMTKPIASVALMMLYEEGHFQLRDPIARWLPEFGAMQVAEPASYQELGRARYRTVEAAQPITVQHLLMGRPQFSWTRIKGESDVAGGRGHGWIETGEGSWVGADGGSPEGDRSRRRRGGGGVGGLGAGATVEREPETGRGVAAAARRAARRGLA